MPYKWKPIHLLFQKFFFGDPEPARLVFSVALGVTLAFCIPQLVLLVRFRRAHPLSGRPFKTLFASCVLMMLAGVSVSLFWVVRRNHPCVMFIVQWATLILMANCYLVRVWLLWYNFKVTNEKSTAFPAQASRRISPAILREPSTSNNLNGLSVPTADKDNDKGTYSYALVPTMSRSSPSRSGHRNLPARLPANGASSVKSATDAVKRTHETSDLHNQWFLTRKHLASDWFLFRLFAVKYSVEFLALAHPVFIPNFWNETVDQRVFGAANIYGDDELLCPATTSAMWAWIMIFSYHSLVLVWGFYRFGAISEAYFIKNEFKWGAITIISLAVVWQLLENLEFNHNVFPLAHLSQCVAVLVVFGIACTYPLSKIDFDVEREIRNSQVLSPPSRSGRRSSPPSPKSEASVIGVDVDLGTYLSDDPRHLAEFREHLKKEFALENIIFWEIVNAYRVGHPLWTAERREAEATTIYTQFIPNDALVQVNLNAQCVEDIEERLEKGDYAIDLFDRAHLCIYRLMARDSFVRFKQKKRRSYFKAQERAHKVGAVAKAKSPTRRRGSLSEVPITIELSAAPNGHS